jgi:hypothetical protein
LRSDLLRWFSSFALAACAFGAAAQSTKLQLSGYEQSLRLMEQGECVRAQDKLFPNGRPHPGDEIAVSDLGSCYLRAANKMSDNDGAERFREIGAGWILMAANAGERKAEQEAVRLYLDGKVFIPDPYEAGKWYTIWTLNRSQIQFGQIEFDADLTKLMNGFSADQWAEARARSARWRPVTLQ